MVSKDFSVLGLWIKVASALEGLMTHMVVRQEINYDTSRVMPFQDTCIKGMILYLQWMVTGKHHLIVIF